MVAWCIVSYGYIEDDAFIHLDYARSVAEGQGFSFNGLHVSGDTAPLWVLLIVAVHSIGIGWIASAKVLGALGVILALSGTWYVARELATGIAQKNLPIAAVLAVGLNPYFIHWAFSGMESVLALGVSLWSIWAIFAGPATRRRYWLGACLLAIAPLLRPELLMLSAVAGTVLLVRYARLSAFGVPHIPALAGMALLMASPTLAWSAYSWHAFGSIIPTTNAAKRGGDLATVAVKLASVYGVGFGGTLLVLLLVAKRGFRKGAPTILWPLLLWPIACVLFYLGNHTITQTRYCLVSMPSLTIATLWLLGQSVQPYLARYLVTGLIALEVVIVFWIVFPHVSNKVELARTTATAAEYIRQHLPANAPIAVFSIGQLGFESRHPLVDLGGITMPGVLPYMNDPAAAERWAKTQGAKFYISGELPEPAAVAVFSYPTPFVGWTFKRSSFKTVADTQIYRLP
jgi:hypothetical protein